MGLSAYNKKRRFNDTPEPEGKEVKDGKQLIFVVQRHEASSLHYDFRLELGGVLKSWAVPKGPSLNPKDKRLAVAVEDHPVSYATFSGDIPEGNYGAGHVDVWDHGTYVPVDDKGAPLSQEAFARKLESGSIRFVLQGKKLQGRFTLRRLNKGDKNWLLMKGKDEYAVAEDYDIEAVKALPGKRKPPTRAPKAAAKAPAATADAEEEQFTDYIRPMLARLHEGPFSDPGWIFEIKWDGYRAVAEIEKGKVRFYSRNGKSFAEDYPPLYEVLRSIKKRMVLDGEIVAFDDRGNPNFQVLQNARRVPTNLYYYVFDILSLNGKSLENKPVTERKRILQEVLPDNDLIRYCDHVTGDGADFFKIMQQRGLEGMIAKRADSVYVEGGRSDDWLKVKHVLTDEAIIVGYTEPKGTRQYFGALILGAYRDGELTYIGHTGTGFNKEILKDLYERMQPLKRPESPFRERVHVNSPVTWLTPELVCNIKFTEVTKDGIHRHPVYQGLRKDKSAGDVTGADAAPSPKSTQMDDSIKANGQVVKITNRDKVYWPEEGYTKGDVIDYYNAVYKYIIKYLKGRPLSLRRNPNGIQDRGFFHKDAGDDAPDWVRREPIWSESSAKDVDYIVCDDKATLLYLVNLGCIELNPWHSRVGQLEYPDYMVLDLDPADKNTFEQVIETAQAIKQVLDGAGATACVKTSGSTGLHIYVPMGAKYTYEQVNAFAAIIAEKANELVPDFTSLERSLKKRGNNIYIDFMQNNIAQTVACAYSLRPKPHAPVSAPLRWEEVKKGLAIEDFTIKNMVKRLEKEGDLFAGALKKGINMEKCLKRLGES